MFPLWCLTSSFLSYSLHLKRNARIIQKCQNIPLVLAMRPPVQGTVNELLSKKLKNEYGGEFAGEGQDQDGPKEECASVLKGRLPLCSSHSPLSAAKQAQTAFISILFFSVPCSLGCYCLCLLQLQLFLFVMSGNQGDGVFLTGI